MKALVLAGGFPQIDLINKLKERGIFTILIDYYANPVAKDYSDKFYRISTLDINAVRKIAIEEKVDFIITVCTDQALLTMAKISEELNLPCYIDYETAKKVTNKEYMKKVFFENNIPCSKFVISSEYKSSDYSCLKYPLIVKPVDCNSSKGVRRVENEFDLKSAYIEAQSLSRTKTVIVEEYISGKELSVDVYIENGKAIVLDITTSEKLKIKDRFIIYRTWHPANISFDIKKKIESVCQKISESFKLYESPMLVQLLTDGKEVYVIEFSARTGGGVKHLSINRRTGIDINSAVIDLTLGKKPHMIKEDPETKYMVDEYVYCYPGVFDHMEGFELLKESGVITDYYQFRSKGSALDSIENSGDRICGFTIQGDSINELKEKNNIINRNTKVISVEGIDIMRHDFIADFVEFEA